MTFSFHSHVFLLAFAILYSIDTCSTISLGNKEDGSRCDVMRAVISSAWRKSYFEFYYDADTICEQGDTLTPIRSFPVNSDIPIVAAASFQNAINSTGWSYQSLMTSDEFQDIYQAYWAGFLETNTSMALTTAHWHNNFKDFCPAPLTLECKFLKQYLSVNLEYAIKMSTLPDTKNQFWYQVGLQLWQLKGISDAFAKRFVKLSTMLTTDYLRELKEDVLGIYLFQLIGDRGTILQALRSPQLEKQIFRHGITMEEMGPSCSALIKVLPNCQDVYLSHVTWVTYKLMLRVLKHYDFPWKTHRAANAETIPGRMITFSSYPSTISSIDDFYITSSKLVIMESTIGNYNTTALELVKNGANSSVLTFFRAMVATRLASNGAEWAEYFQQQNSGTYNNQWMIFDAKLFRFGNASLQPGLLTILEEIPGLVEHADVTKVLEAQTYWPSYNTPYFQNVYKLSGWPEKRKKFGDHYSYNKTARANIFRRDHSKVVNLPSMFRLMRYNDFRHDPLSRCNGTPPYTAYNAISARNDLNDPYGTYPIDFFRYSPYGGTDVKLVNFEMLEAMNMIAVVGPTHDNFPPFQWSKLPVPMKKPEMYPDIWMFPPVITNFTTRVQTWTIPSMPFASAIPVF